MINRQQVFDYAIYNILKQGGPAVEVVDNNYGYQRCRFRVRMKDGTLRKCAAGQLFRKTMDVGPGDASRGGASEAALDTLVNSRAALEHIGIRFTSESDMSFIWELVRVHDNSAMTTQGWEGMFRTLARQCAANNGLDPKYVDTPLGPF